MDDLIVIILTLIVAGVGVLGQLKKKKQAQTGSESNKKATNSFWDLIQGETDFNQQGVKSDFEETDFDNQQEEVLVKKPVYGFDRKKDKELEIERDIKETTRKSKIKSGVMNDFSLRKAVIYSEILNRKYT
jgi:hypothetical protein